MQQSLTSALLHVTHRTFTQDIRDKPVCVCLAYFSETWPVVRVQTDSLFTDFAFRGSVNIHRYSPPSLFHVTSLPPCCNISFSNMAATSCSFRVRFFLFCPYSVGWFSWHCSGVFLWPVDRKSHQSLWMSSDHNRWFYDMRTEPHCLFFRQ